MRNSVQTIVSMRAAFAAVFLTSFVPTSSAFGGPLPPTVFVFPTDVGAASGDTITIVAPESEARETTDVERAVAEIRRWGFVDADWDGEGARKPLQSSQLAAISFIGALGAGVTAPEPMLHSSGRAGLFWRGDHLYAHLEFTGDGRVAYYIERGDDKHKGIVGVEPHKVPDVLENLLPGSALA